MATQKVRHDPNTLEGQHHGQRHGARRKATVVVLIGAFVLGGVALGISLLREDATVTPESAAPAGGASTSTVLPLPGGIVEPGRYIFSSADPDLDASHRITIDVPDGYHDFDGVAVIKDGASQTSVSTLAISDVYADPCRWSTTLLDRSEISSTDDVVAALASQQGFRVSTPTAVTVDGFAGTYMERRLPARTVLSDCDSGQFRVYLSPDFGERYLYRGQLQELWVIDVDGVPLVIDASIDQGTSAEIRAELLQMVESIQIDAR